jgi:hypothetical protein
VERVLVRRVQQAALAMFTPAEEAGVYIQHLLLLPYVVVIAAAVVVALVVLFHNLQDAP